MPRIKLKDHGQVQALIFFIIFFLLMVMGTIFVVLITMPNLAVHLGYTIFGRTTLTSMPFRKGPMIQIIGDKKVAILWEDAKLSSEAEFIWDSDQIVKVKPDTIYIPETNSETFLYKAVIEEIESGPIGYDIKYDGIAQHKFRISVPSWRAEKLRIAVVGDSQMGFMPFRRLLPRVSQMNPDLFLHLGDMVQTPSKDFDWQTYFFDSLRYSSMLERIPFLITQGNHDVISGDLSPYFPKLASLSGGATGYYYAVTIGPARLIILDSNTEDDDQISWLQNELSRNFDNKFRIVSVHVPPFLEFWEPKSWENGEKQWTRYVRERMVPLFEQYKVDLVISGHQHNYQRGSRNGVNYLISGGGGGTLDNQRVEDFKMYEKTYLNYHFVILDITEKSIKLTMWQQNGRLGDELIINK